LQAHGWKPAIITAPTSETARTRARTLVASVCGKKFYHFPRSFCIEEHKPFKECGVRLFGERNNFAVLSAHDKIFGGDRPMRLSLVLLASVIISACASSPDDMQTQYVSEFQYQNHDCDQLAFEEKRITSRVSVLYDSLYEKAGDDAGQMGIGLIFFWPALFLLEGGDGPEADEFSRLKGEHQAIERVAFEKKCGLNITPISDHVLALKKEKRAEEIARRKANNN
jgi:hypothetical protein